MAEDRLDSFQAGHQREPGDPAVSEQQNVSPGFRPNGTNMQIVAGQDAQSDTDYRRGTIGGGQTPTTNSMSESTYAAKRPLMNTSLGV